MRRRTSLSIVSAAALSTLLSCSSAPPAKAPAAPRSPIEDTKYANEWPSPNGDLYNTRVAHSTISSSNVSKLAVTWTVPLTGAGANGRDFANPVVANGVAYLQDGASNVMAVQVSSGKLLWSHLYNSPDYGPNGVTIANGKIYGVTATGVFALDAGTGRQVWYDTHLATGKVSFDIPAQVGYGKVFVSSALTVGGGIIYALDADTGAKVWSFQTVSDKIGQQLSATAGGAWDAVMIGPDNSIYAGIGNPYLSQKEAQTTPSRELYTDSIVKLDQATGKLDWYYQAFPNDFHDWDLQVSPIYTVVGARAIVLAAGKGGFVFAFDPSSGTLMWKTAVGVHNGHDQDGQLALDGKLQLTPPYALYPGQAGGVETNMAAADGVVYVPVVDLPWSFASTTERVGKATFGQGTGEMVAIDLATGQQLWATKLAQIPFGGATVATDLVFTTTLTGDLIALSRKDGSIVWTSHLPAGSNATLAISGDTLLAGAGLPLNTTQHAAVVAYRVGAS
jgi:outer membrane protein assembly factor BamB